MKRIFTLCSLLLFALVSQAQMMYLKAELQGSQQVPANASTASGVVIVKYNMATNYLELTGDYQRLSAPVNASHIHSPAMPGTNAPVLIPLANTGDSSGTLSGTSTLTDAQETDLLAGNMYVNVHNSIYPNGEIRGQLTTTTSGKTDFMTARLQGAQQVPPNGSLAMGSASVLLDNVTKMVYLTGSFSGLSVRATGAHIHKAEAGTNGPIFVYLERSQGTAGALHAVDTLTDANVNQIVTGNAYVNVHDSLYPEGEIRGQLVKQQKMYLKAVLQGRQQVPANNSTATGVAIVKYDPDTKVLELVGDYQNVISAVTASHIHSPAPVGSNAPVLFPLENTGGTSGVLTGTDTLTQAQEMDLLAGNMYVNVHNSIYPGGEIRGQLGMTTVGETQYLKGNLQGSQQVPANASEGSGSVTVLLDKVTNEVFTTGDFHGLSSAAAAGHIHREPAGSNGPVIVPLSVTADVSGTIDGTATVSESFADSMVLGLTYINIHNSVYPGGEIRAQLGDLVLPVKLQYFNGYRQNNKIALIWESAQELNLKQYDIEQQGQEPGRWINKGTVTAKGGNIPAKYSFLDQPVINRTNYVIYRLKMTDADGKFEYSSLVRINFVQSKMALTLGANPVSDGQLRYTISGVQTDRKAEVSIIDYSGRIVMKTTASALANNSINVSRLPAGVYKMVVWIDDSMLQQSFAK